MKKITTLLLMVFANVYFLTGQNILWSKNYGGSGDEETRAIQQTSDGGYIVAWETSSTDGDVYKWGIISYTFFPYPNMQLVF